MRDVDTRKYHLWDMIKVDLNEVKKGRISTSYLLKRENKYCGYVSIASGRECASAHLSYAIQRKFRHLGIAKEMLQELRDHLIREEKIKKILLLIQIENQASKSVALSSQFEKTGMMGTFTEIYEYPPKQKDQ